MSVTTLPPFNSGYSIQPQLSCEQRLLPQPVVFQQGQDTIQVTRKCSRNLLTAIGLYALAATSHKLPLPPRLPEDGFKTILPTDWKVWARVMLGITAVNKLNQAMEWKLPPWQGALETMAIVTPLATAFETKALLQTLVMTPFVAGAVQGTSMATQSLEKPIQNKTHLPPLATQLGLSTILGLGALLIYPPIYKTIAKTGIIGKQLKDEAAESASAFSTITFSNCIRGCSPGSFICLSELADVGGSLSIWLKDKLSGNHKKPGG